MLSIKHIGRGIETVYLAHEATFIPSEAAAKCFTRSPIEAATEGGCVNIIRENGVLLGLVGGMVYVMNESGKTVAKYDLGVTSTLPLPHDPGPQFGKPPV